MSVKVFGKLRSLRPNIIVIGHYGEFLKTKKPRFQPSRKLLLGRLEKAAYDISKKKKNNNNSIL